MKSGKVSRREVFRRACGTATVLLGAAGSDSGQAAPLDIRDRYSPKNRSRPKRPETLYIVLHTTEGSEAGSLDKIWRRGEAHYFVTERGRVYRIVHRSRIATHAGRSMWEGRGPIDNLSIGIEIVGFHDRDLSEAQYESVRELLRQLKSVYRIPDQDVITHSMVAYGRPNRFHPYNHRGRKRCGMIFARTEVRRKLGLEGRPSEDPDVSAGRLKVADPELYANLFSPEAQPARVGEPGRDENVITRERTAWYIARDLYNRPETIYVLPTGERRRGDEVTDWGRIPEGTQVLVGQETLNGFEGFSEAGESDTGRSLAGESYAAATTIYIFPNGMVRTGLDLANDAAMSRLLAHLPAGTKVLVGYVYGGHVKSSRLPARIAGKKWNYPSTFYRLPDGRILSGDEIDEAQIPPNTLVLFQS